MRVLGSEVVTCVQYRPVHVKMAITTWTDDGSIRAAAHERDPTSTITFILFYFLIKILQECRDIQRAKAIKKYTELIKQQKTNYVSSGNIAVRYTETD